MEHFKDTKILRKEIVVSNILCNQHQMAKVVNCYDNNAKINVFFS